MELTKIELTKEDALMFIKFQQRYAFMQLLESVGAFDIQSGSIEVHFNAIGGINSVDIHRHLRISK